MKTIIVGVTGSIAAYKAADLVSQLTKKGHDVHVTMTAAAREFITPLTLQTLSHHNVVTDPFDLTGEWKPGHIALADQADLPPAAPASAHTIAALAHGFANNYLTEIALATRAPILIAPAMNGKMWEHPATQENVEKLKSRGVQFIGPEAGLLACGYEGLGRLWPVDGIVACVDEMLS
jgi:phosphopantothenoylcysteine synthetase/decarboxylase